MDIYKILNILNEFAPGGGDSGRWYTDDQITDLVGNGWWQEMDVSGNIPKDRIIQRAQAWLEDQGYSVSVLNVKVNDDDCEWYIEGSFHNPNFAKPDMHEDSMDDAEKHATGPEFTGYWKGTDKRTPGTHMVGGSMEESLEDEIANEWAAHLNEYGMTTGGTVNNPNGTSTNSVDQAKAAKELSNAQQNVNKIKAAGVTLPAGASPSQVAKTSVATTNDPKIQATGGQNLDQTSKKATMSLGQEMEKLLATGNPSQVQQVANAIKQSKLGQK